MGDIAYVMELVALNFHDIKVHQYIMELAFTVSMIYVLLHISWSYFSLGSMIWTLSPNIMVFFSFCLHDTEVLAYIMGFLFFYFHDVEVAVHIMGSLPFQPHGVHALTYIMEITHVLLPPPFDHTCAYEHATRQLRSDNFDAATQTCNVISTFLPPRR